MCYIWCNINLIAIAIVLIVMQMIVIINNANDPFIPSEVTNRTIADRHYTLHTSAVPNWQPDTAGHFLYELLLTVGTWKYILCVCCVWTVSSLQSQLCWLVRHIFPPAPPAPAPRDAASPRIHVKNNSIVFQLGPALFLAAWRHPSGSWEEEGGPGLGSY